MKRKGHLRLVSTRKDPVVCSGILAKIEDFIEDLFISRNEKIYILKDLITEIYRDYEVTTGICDIPYFVKAENKMRKIIYENKIDYYYRKLKNYRKAEAKRRYV